MEQVVEILEIELKSQKNKISFLKWDLGMHVVRLSDRKKRIHEIETKEKFCDELQHSINILNGFHAPIRPDEADKKTP